MHAVSNVPQPFEVRMIATGRHALLARFGGAYAPLESRYDRDRS